MTGGGGVSAGCEEDVGDEFVDLWLEEPGLSRGAYRFVSVVEGGSGSNRTRLGVVRVVDGITVRR
jgi:hypothetical protein